MFFLISVGYVTLLKRLSQLAFSDRIKRPDIKKKEFSLALDPETSSTDI